MDKLNSCQILDDSNTIEVPITPQEFNDISNIQQEILSMVASDVHTNDILDSLCKMAEALLVNSVASIMLLDSKTKLLNVRSAPSIPQAGQDALANLKPGEGGGSCGNAVFRAQPQYVQNTFTDQRWSDIRDIAYNFNLCSCWSMPIINDEKQAIGSFALSSFEHRSPALFHKQLLKTASSITTIVLKKERTEKRMKLFLEALDNANEGVIITDKNNHIIETNKAFHTIYGYSFEDVSGKDPKMFASKKQSDTFYKNMWHAINTKNSFVSEIVNKNKDGKELIQWISITAIKDEMHHKKIENYLAIYTDLTEIKNSQAKVEYLAYHDSLTKLNNKSKLEQILEKNSQNQSLILLNINNFSYINSAYGFEIGDQVLQKISKIFLAVFKLENVFRIDSDQFAILIDQEKDITEFIKEIQSYFHDRYITINKITLNISFTYGAAYATENILKNAAQALKLARENGKNHIHIYSKSDTLDNEKRKSFLMLNTILHNSFSQDTMVPFFQGIYDNKKKSINKYETLVRIINGGKILSPYEFLSTAKLSGLLPNITKIMVEKSFAIMASNDYTFSINITEDDLNMHYLTDFLTTQATLFKINPNRVVLEILEGISAYGKGSSVWQLNELKSKGFKLAIDDFGAEYSNFERILDLDVDFIKIDAKYIKNMDVDEKSYEITKSIAYFTQNIGVTCIAEFVHSQAIQNIIEDLGIEFSQGYLFSEPSQELKTPNNSSI